MFEFDILGVLVAVCVLVSSVYLYRHVLILRNKTYAPGPWGLPVVGHLLQFGENPPETFMKWREKYGDIFRIRLGSWNAIVLNGYSVIKEAMERKDDAFSDRPRFYIVDILKKVYDGQECYILRPFNQSYIQMDKIAASALHKYTHVNITQTQELILEEAAILIEEFLSWKGEPHSTEEAIRISVSSILYQILYGRGQNMREDIFFQRLVDCSNEFVEFTGSGNPFDVMPWLRFVMPWKGLKLFRIIKKAVNTIPPKILEHKETFDKSYMRDITDMLLAADLPDDATDEAETLTKKGLLLPVLMELMSAGQETTFTTLVLLLIYMAEYPDIQRRVQQEIDDCIGCGRSINANDRSVLCYTDACMYEVMRLTSIVPFSDPHRAIKDTKLGGFDIDENTVIITNLHSAHMDRKTWEEPEVFNPERLLSKRSEIKTSGYLQDGQTDVAKCQPDVDTPQQYTDKWHLDVDRCNRIIPFGLGRRRCTGEALAKLDLFLLFSNIMQRCTFTKAKNPTDLIPIPGLIYKPKSVKLVVQER